MKIDAVQFSPVRDPYLNLERIRSLADMSAELIVIPELSDFGYFADREFLMSNDNSAFLEGMRELSLGRAVMCGASEREGDELYNTLWFWEKGVLRGKYRKMHLTDYEKEIFISGKESTVFELSDGTRIAPSICFDLWFPEFFREGKDRDADLFVSVGAFGGPTSLSMAVARAGENSVPLILANRSGGEMFEGSMEPFLGCSRIIDWSGRVLVEAKKGEDDSITFDLSLEKHEGNVICRDMMREIERHSC